MKNIPVNWKRLGPVIKRGGPGEIDSHVAGDPCIVWDEEISAYRMFYFAQKMSSSGNEQSGNAMAIASQSGKNRPQSWNKAGPVMFTNPEALRTDWGTHKPFILMDAFQPNCPAFVDGKYRLFTVTYRNRRKCIQVAFSPTLSGPWTLQEQPVLSPGSQLEFDGYHADTVTAFWFQQRGEILLFYKGYPMSPQPDTPHSPFGSRQAAAIIQPDDRTAVKMGQTIRPTEPGHWMSGWIGGLQLLPCSSGGWWGLLNASPSAPGPLEQSPTMREPAPSQGGWVFTEEEFPISGWKAVSEPLRRVAQLTQEEIRDGEGVNFWRHHALLTSDNSITIYYNSGPYGQEQTFGRTADL